MQRTLLRNLMSGHIWRAHRAERYPRQVYVCFGRAAGIAARRIVESNPEGSLERVHIISLPWGDPVPQASEGIVELEERIEANKRCYEDMYRQYAKLFFNLPA